MKMVLESNKEGNGSFLLSPQTSSLEIIKSIEEVKIQPDDINALLKSNLNLVNGFTEPPDEKINNLVISTANIIYKQCSSYFLPAESKPLELRKVLIESESKFRDIKNIDYCIKELFVKNHAVLNAVKLSEISKQKSNTSINNTAHTSANNSASVSLNNSTNVFANSTNASTVNSQVSAKISQVLTKVSQVSTNVSQVSTNVPQALTNVTQALINVPLSSTTIPQVSTNILQVSTNVSQVNNSTSEGLEFVTMIKSNKNYSELLPPTGELKRPDLQIGNKVLMKSKNVTINLPVWVDGTIIKIRDALPCRLFKIRIDDETSLIRLLSAKELAYNVPSPVLVPVGIRVIARYKLQCNPDNIIMVAGIVAEPPKIINKCRYLIFFDDGCAQYVKCNEVHLVCEQSKDVSQDIDDIKLKEFIKKYLFSYPERPMVKLQPGQVIHVENDFNCWRQIRRERRLIQNSWWKCEVEEVDCSMVKIKYRTTNVREWLYRGSQRIRILFEEFEKSKANRSLAKPRRHNLLQKKPHQPYVEYTREHDIVTLSDSDDELNKFDVKTKPRNTAIKSTGGKRIKSLNVPCFSRDVKDTKSHAGYKEMRQLKKFNRTQYKPHTCCKGCKETVSPSLYNGENPLLIPLLLGWERQLRKSNKRRRKITVMYRAPCGRHLRTIKEVCQYLFKVSSTLSISFFTFNFNVLIFRQFRPKEILYHDEDITKGKEQVPVECVNSLSNESPPYFEYASERYPGNDVRLNLDPNFLCGCDCTDNCQSYKRCQCRQLTIRANTPNGQIPNKVGYKHGRLKSSLITGIYECNSQCKCSSSCLNRVVQHGLQVRLQMFKTLKKGWGIRCIDDIDAGTFICIYAGQLLTDDGADHDGNQFGDEYLAELDHIEVVEANKNGYETDVTDIEMEEENKKAFYNKEAGVLSSDSDEIHADSDSDFETPLRTTATSTYATRSKQKEKTSNSTCSSPLLDENSKSSLNESEDKDSIDIVYSNISKSSSKNHSNHSDSESRASKRLKLNNGKIAKKSSAKQFIKPHSTKKNKFISIRELYGEQSSCFIMDAKSKGNIGRYLNHSCEPNVFVQNVFIDTHDLRFPTVAFFAEKQIDAGTELTWDYNYDVGSVKGKVMYCYCDANYCRGRLL